MTLQCHGLRRQFGALKAVDDVSLSVSDGARHALIGPNGAGKSTLFKLITGLLRSDGGRVELAGQDVTKASEVRRCRLGISQTLQHASLFPTMSAAENIVLAVQRHEGKISWLPSRQRSVHERADSLLDQVGLTGRGSVTVSSLSHGERKQLEVALALACRPKLLLLDEPAAGMSAAERARLVALVSSLPSAITVLFVEHDLDLVFELADTVTVLNLGRVLLSGDPAEVKASEEVRQAYLGAGSREELFR
ncbi:ABC transporter ATP-binding protein [Kibdelosporangium philippinense]|uniref:ABC transporter ATP-binding protein n=1 Tax=Kibdelosporangium philippinense TaxID=211113 RepID=A0ABS8Z577_9PSEU|nr:ABC transporter ATP-binding protein [Kibdelosporangium philippinense]MCE7002975.1 ABC transporter ATP-binding protein [Kibdelosporangium philippinense]